LINTLAIARGDVAALRRGLSTWHASGDTLRLWDIGGVKARQIGAWSHEVDGKRESIVDVAMTPNGKRWLFIAFSETRITLWNPETSDVMNTFPNPSC